MSLRRDGSKLVLVLGHIKLTIGINTMCDALVTKAVSFLREGVEFLYKMPTSFSTVSTYSEDNGRCSINIDTGIWTPLKALTTATLPSFYTK